MRYRDSIVLTLHLHKKSDYFPDIKPFWMCFTVLCNNVWIQFLFIHLYSIDSNIKLVERLWSQFELNILKFHAELCELKFKLHWPVNKWDTTLMILCYVD